MAQQVRKQNAANTKRPKLKFFFINDQLHKKLFINRGKDIIITWNYPEEKKITYTYSDVIRRFKPAFTTMEVCAMVNRKRYTLLNAMGDGNIEKPQLTYSIDENRNKGSYYWSEKNILDLLAFLATVHKGRPRNDGEVIPMYLPTPRELRAMINNENMLYVKQGDTFVPSWRAKEF